MPGGEEVPRVLVASREVLPLRGPGHCCRTPGT
jgi:hypothetical protein